MRNLWRHWPTAALVAMLLLMAGVGRAHACVPSQATVGMIGCEPVVSAVAPTDFVEVWLPGIFPRVSPV